MLDYKELLYQVMTDYFECQYNEFNEDKKINGPITLGPMSSFTWNNDPKRLLFVLSRYKFAGRVLEGAHNVIEIGCGDGFASRIVRQHVDNLLLTDIDKVMVELASKSGSNKYPVSTAVHNFSESSLENSDEFDGAYLLDVLEHIPREKEEVFLRNIKYSLACGSTVVIGMPSIESQDYASKGSKEGHVNCKTKEDLNKSLKLIFKSVVCFSMNDEVVHTGFNRMANYLMAVCTT